MASSTQLVKMVAGRADTPRRSMADLGMQVTIVDMEANPGGVCSSRVYSIEGVAACGEGGQRGEARD